MKTRESLCLHRDSLGQTRFHRGRVDGPLSTLHLVSGQEVLDLREALAEGRVPRDLQIKLANLEGGSLLHHFIGQNGALFVSLSLAVEEGAFRGCSPEELDRLVRVLAYVRKDDDAIPDHQPGGFVDDHQEVRAATRDLERLLSEFKQWRLQHQVPRLWLSRREQPTACRL
jgi:hypothetical protein